VGVVCVVVFASARYVKLLFFLYDMAVLLPFIKKPRCGVGGGSNKKKQIGGDASKYRLRLDFIWS
jgi:hypothetical protein